MKWSVGRFSIVSEGGSRRGEAGQEGLRLDRNYRRLRRTAVSTVLWPAYSRCVVTVFPIS